MLGMGGCGGLSPIKLASNRPIAIYDQETWVTGVKRRIQAQYDKATSKEAGRPDLVHEGNLVYLNASSRLVCQLDESRRQLDRLERHANRMLRSVGAH